MKVNELKAMFQKNKAFQSQIPMPPKSVFHPPPPHIETTPPTANVQIMETTQTVEPAVPVPTQKPIAKNADFLNELNKKLQMKTIKPKVIESQGHPEQVIPIISDLPQKLPEMHCEIQAPQVQEIEIVRPTVEIKENLDQLNFDDIMNNVEKEAVFKSTLKARLGINERHPISKEEEDIFTQWQIQRNSELMVEEKQNNLGEVNQCISRNTKAIPGAYHSNVLYSKLSKAQKMKRIDSIISSIFNGKHSEIISIKPAKPQQKIFVKTQLVSTDQSSQQNKEQQIKNEQILIVDPSKSMKINQEQMGHRSMFAMSKEMLSQMNFKIKRRNDIINAQTNPQSLIQERNKQRSVSPSSKKKKNLQKFDDA